MDQGITKDQCYFEIHKAGIVLPEMYLLGYDNNNCIGCPKGGMGYRNKIKRDFPERFNRVAMLSRQIGAKLLKRTVDGVETRHFLDELQDEQAGLVRRDEKIGKNWLWKITTAKRWNKPATNGLRERPKAESYQSVSAFEQIEP